MMEYYTLNQVKDMFEIVKKIEGPISIISEVNCGDPRGGSYEAKKELKKLIPEYKKKIPEEIQKVIGITTKNLEERIK